MLRRFAHFLDADLQAAEPARVLRLPGTQNFKYTPPRQARVEMLEPARRYHISEFDDLLPPEPVAVNGTTFVAPEKILDGQRNGTLFKEARSLKAKNFSRKAIRVALHAENQEKCEPPLSDTEIEEIVESAWSQADRPEFTHGRSQPPPDEEQLSAEHDDPQPVILGVGLGAFLSLNFPPSQPLVEGVLSNDGGGWISGEEKLKKSFYALAEALGLPVCGRFAVLVRRRVMFIEEEDSPARTYRRVQALLRGYGLDPDDPAVRADLDAWFRILVWSGFTLDAPLQIDQLARTIATFQPTVVYLDVLRKLTTKDLNKADQAGALLKILDDLRREHGVLFRVLHHNRKIQGSYRAGRGSQELSGSYQLGAWGENSLFFEPIGKTQGVKVTPQCKGGAPVHAFGLRMEAEGPAHAPICMRLHAEDLSQASAAEALKEQVFEAVQSLPPEEAKSGHPGISREAICHAVKRSSFPVRTAIQALADEGRLKEIGKTSKQKKLYR